MLQRHIISFDPELVITFNYATYYKLLDYVSCPIVIWDADLYHLWNQVEFIKNNVDRFTFFCFSDFGIKYARVFFNIKQSKIFLVENATSLKAEKLKKNVNISFIGTYFGSSRQIIDFITQYAGKKELFEILNFIKNNSQPKPERIIKFMANNCGTLLASFLQIKPETYSGFFSSENRINALNSICDLGLELYGDRGWLSIANVLPSLAACYNRKVRYSAEDNQFLYNSSKICINISHTQSSYGMPWRVCDIMATSGCLISSYSHFIAKCFDKYVKIPMYHNQFEARELCVKLLKDEILRDDIVNGSNLAIKERYRWPMRFKQMEEIFGIPLINNDQEGSIRLIKPSIRLVRVKIDTLSKSAIAKREISKSAIAKRENRNYYHFNMKIWPGKRLDIKIMKKNH
jgi:hypothetical protein